MEYALAARLPPEMWPDALRFFSTRPESPVPDLLGTTPSASLDGCDGVEPPALAGSPAARESELSG